MDELTEQQVAADAGEVSTDEPARETIEITAELCKCPYCDTDPYARHSYLRRHVKDFHPEEFEAFAQAVKVARTKVREEEAAERGSSIRCPMCDEPFASSIQCDSHIRFAHADAIGSIFQDDEESITLDHLDPELREWIKGIVAKLKSLETNRVTISDVVNAIVDGLNGPIFGPPVPELYEGTTVEGALSELPYGFEKAFNIPRATISRQFRKQVESELRVIWPNVRRSRVRAMFEGDFTNGIPAADVLRNAVAQTTHRRTMLVFDIFESFAARRALCAS